MKRFILALLVGGAVFAVVAFAAAGIPNLSAGNLSQGQANVNNCAGEGLVTLGWNTSGANWVGVDSVNVNAPDSCAGAVATVEVFDNVAGYQTNATCTLNGSGNCANAPLAAKTDVALVDWARVTLAGP